MGLVVGAAAAEITDADVLNYNAAVASGNVEQIRAAAQQLASAAIASEGDPQASLIAYESGWVLCQIGACAEALPAAEFAAAQAGGPEGATLLKAFAAWKVNPSVANEKSVDAALGAIQSAPPTGLSTSAVRERYASELQSRNFDDAARLAQLATAHFAAGGEAYERYLIEARTIDISSRFNVKPKASQLEEMIHLRGELSRSQHLYGDNVPDWMEKSFWVANAWQSAMNAFFSSEGKPGVSEKRAEQILESYENGLEQADAKAADVDPEPKLPLCEGNFVRKPAMRYPSGMGSKGQFGALIVRFRFEEGKVRDPEVLAAVPMDGFRDEVLKTISKWYFKPSVDPAKAGCTLNRDSLIQEFVFSLQ
ncbi:MAG: energy transducer TonB [Alphaproteobacteria bacterium]|nr:energy transducer TonB [Alphaproteobacteria bacterium]